MQAIATSIFIPPIGACLLASTGAVGKCVELVENSVGGDWQAACDNLLALVGVALADQFGRAGEWIPVRTPPENAIVGGHIVDTPRPVYIGRAFHNGNLHPGKVAFYRGGWHCFIGNGGREEEYDRYEVLVGSPSSFKWSSIVKNQKPDSAVEGGRISDTPYPVYVGRAYHNGNSHPGKVSFYRNAWRCFIGNGGHEQEYNEFEVLLRA